MADTQFDPRDHMSKVKGRDYLEVKHRIAWLRAEHPDAILETELVSLESGRVIMRARVVLPTGGIGTGWGSCTQEEFENFIEKAETKAIGRALTALGYGTPADDDEPSSSHPPTRSHNQNSSSGGAFMATPPQKSRIQRLATELRLNEAALEQLTQRHTGTSFATITKRQASGLIDLLESRRGHAVPNAAPAQSNQTMSADDKKVIDLKQAMAKLAADRGISEDLLPGMLHSKYGKAAAELAYPELQAAYAWISTAAAPELSRHARKEGHATPAK